MATLYRPLKFNSAHNYMHYDYILTTQYRPNHVQHSTGQIMFNRSLKILGPAGCDSRHQNRQISIQEVQVSNASVSEITAWPKVLTQWNIILTSSNKCVCSGTVIIVTSGDVMIFIVLESCTSLKRYFTSTMYVHDEL